MIQFALQSTIVFLCLLFRFTNQIILRKNKTGAIQTILVGSEKFWQYKEIKSPQWT